jgi:hypothetical protein
MTVTFADIPNVTIHLRTKGVVLFTVRTPHIIAGTSFHSQIQYPDLIAGLPGIV